MPRRKKTKNIVFINLSKILFWLSFLVLLYFIYTLFISNILPVKYLTLIIIIFSLLYLIYFFLIKKYKKKAMIIFDICAVLFVLLELFAIFKLDDTIDFIKKNFINKSETLTYNIIVNSNSNYNGVDDLNDIEVLYYKDIDNDSLLLNQVKQLNIKLYSDTPFELLNSVVSNNDVALISSAYYEMMLENNEEYESNTRIIASYDITVDKKMDDVNIDVTNTPFVLFINGIDTRSGKLPARSLSDVNIIMAVNPNTRNILMVAIPRDYYVQLHGTTGLKDKLTHSGTYGGVKNTMATIEDLFDIKLNYYMRMNFNSVINLVDAVGGINLYSDVNYSFTCHTNRSCTFNPGNNFVDGKCALAFARERKSYNTGDRHRGENQEQVISVLFDKITTSSTLINDYSKILKALNGTFETSLDANDITSLVKMQIDDMKKWNINTYNVSGTPASDYTHSYPSQKLSVMYPNYSTVETAKTKINEILAK